MSGIFSESDVWLFIGLCLLIAFLGICILVITVRLDRMSQALSRDEEQDRKLRADAAQWEWERRQEHDGGGVDDD